MSTQASDELSSIRSRLVEHPLHGRLRTAADLQHFAERHVVCVFDFMSLLKSLQRDLTCVAVPWSPPRDSASARLVNQIVLDEESDAGGGFEGSHFEWYLAAMRELGCDVAPAESLAARVATGSSLCEALSLAGLPDEARRFGEVTAGLLDSPVHARAAAFLHGREDVLPALFTQVVEAVDAAGSRCPVLLAYLRRHVALDGDSHGPATRRLLERLCGDDRVRRREADAAGVVALRARLELWDAIAAGLPVGR